MNLATRITLLRLFLVPVFVVLIACDLAGHPSGAHRSVWLQAALGVFLLAAFSDALDGYLARHWNQASPLGALLDPIADKLLLFAALIMLTLLQWDGLVGFPIWFFILVVSRDLILLIGYLILHHYRLNVEVKPHWSGKLSTFFTFFAIGAVLLQLRSSIMPLCLLAGIMTFLSTLVYIRQGFQRLGQARASAS